MGTRWDTEWKIVLAGAQYLTSLTKSCVKALKHTLDHMLEVSIARAKPMLNYTEQGSQHSQLLF